MKLSRACDVISVLSKRASLSAFPGVKIKADMSCKEKDIEKKFYLRKGGL